MTRLFDSFWRAAAYCLLPRVLLLSLVPMLVMALVALGLGFFFWEPAVEAVRGFLESFDLLRAMSTWLQGMGLSDFRAVLAPWLVFVVVSPVLGVVTLLTVSLLMVPALVRLVGQRRFAGLEPKHGASFLRSAAWGVGSLLLALLALVLSLPLWFVPPLGLVLPPLIGGWLTYRVFAFDALADYASAAEREQILRAQRVPLIVMGVVCGFVGAAPLLVFGSMALFALVFVALAPVVVWMYTAIFVFSSLWFLHYCLAALADLRGQTLVVDATAPPTNPAPPGFPALPALPGAPTPPPSLPPSPPPPPAALP